jgi:hypothetical protein
MLCSARRTAVRGWSPPRRGWYSPLPNLAYGRRWLSRMRCGRGGQS